MIKLPNFLLVGAAKSATTSLFHYLNQHPEVFIPDEKELKFLTGPLIFEGPGSDYAKKTRTTSFKDYKKFFEDAPENAKAIGEATPHYLYYHEPTIKNIKKYLNEDINILMILRNPADRAFSAYMHQKRQLYETLPFKEALDAEEERIANNYPTLWHYKGLSMYFNQVEAYLKAFKNVKVIIYEQLRQDEATIVNELYEFIGVDTSFQPKIEIHNISGNPKYPALRRVLNSTGWIKIGITKLVPKSFKRKIRRKFDKVDLVKEKMSTIDREYLNDYFKEDIGKLSKLLKVDLSKYWG